MSGRDYLENIQTELQSGRHQHRMGENVLRAFGYVRRRATAVNEINTTLDELGLVADPPISSDMPLRAPHIRFSLKDANSGAMVETVDSHNASDSDSADTQLQDVEDSDSNFPEPGFSVSELASANCDVNCVSPSASTQEAYTTMLLHKYSQLVVANSSKPGSKTSKGSCRSNRWPKH